MLAVLTSPEWGEVLPPAAGPLSKVDAGAKLGNVPDAIIASIGGPCESITESSRSTAGKISNVAIPIRHNHEGLGENLQE